MNACRHVFSPLQVGRFIVKNRIEAAPAGMMLASSDCAVTRDVIEWYKGLARSGCGIVTVGDSPVISEMATGVGHLLNLGTDKAINGLDKLAEAIKRYGALASIELTYHNYFVSESATDMTVEKIRYIIDSHVQAARRCVTAGLDMIMIHIAHGHFLSQFFSPQLNKRTDAYGGSFENRIRVITELLDGIRDRFGDRLGIELRISGDELTPGGLNVDDQLRLAKSLEGRVDLVHISAGKLYDEKTIPRMFQPTYLPRGINVYLAEMFRKELKVPVVAVGSLTVEMAEEIIAMGKADMVALARALIADPDHPAKARNGRDETIRPCVRCNTCIDRVHRSLLSVHCAVNPMAGREVEFKDRPLPRQKKKVVVVGGGPAGMEAARRAADRGHEVVLFEKNDRLGGALIMASAAPFKADMKAYLEWAIRMTMTAPNLTVRLSTEATREIIGAENPDAVVVAVGAVPVMPADLPGVGGRNVVWAGDVDCGTAVVGERVVVAGAGLTGSETALHLAQSGKKVTLIDMLPLEEIDADTPFVNVISLRSLVDELGIDVRTGVKLDAVTDRGAVIMDKDSGKIEIPCDTVVLSLGVKPRSDLVRLFEDLAPEVYQAGDCSKERGNLYSAVLQGFFAGMEI